MKLGKVDAKRKNSYVWFYCQLQINNNTGGDLGGKSNYNTDYTGSLMLVVSDRNGKEIARASRNMYLAPWSSEPMTIVLPTGENFPELNVPIDETFLPANLAGVRVRVEGILPGSSEVYSTKQMEIVIPEKSK
jgi:hypothetical protein